MTGVNLVIYKQILSTTRTRESPFFFFFFFFFFSDIHDGLVVNVPFNIVYVISKR